MIWIAVAGFVIGCVVGIVMMGIMAAAKLDEREDKHE